MTSPTTQELIDSEFRTLKEFVSEVERLLSKTSSRDYQEDLQFRMRTVSSQLHQATRAADVLVGLLSAYD